VDPNTTPASNRILVVFYSRDGHTRRIATRIAAACQADLEEITDAGGRAGALGYLRCVLEAGLGLAASVHSGRRQPQGYALVVVGTPVWMWNMASPVRRYLQVHSGRLPRLALFCTYGGAGQDKVLRDMARLGARVPVATLALKAEQCEAGGSARGLGGFVRELQQAVASAESGAGRQRQAA
jgi:flavodoxin